MRATIRWCSAVFFLVIGPVAAQASGASFGDQFNVTFNGVATLGLLVSALMVFLGYRLLMQGTTRRRPAPHSNVRVGGGRFNLAISNAAPGVVFAALGCVGMVASLWHIAK